MPRQTEKRSVLPDFLAEIARLQEAQDLLERIWLEGDPYDHRFSPEVTARLHKFFNFDDSE
jgi:hypothetical protein